VVLVAIAVRLVIYAASSGLDSLLGIHPVPTLNAAQTLHDPLTGGADANADWPSIPPHCSFGDDGYHIADNYGCFAHIAAATDVDVSASVQQVGGSPLVPYGLLLRHSGTKNAYLFAIDSNGKWLFAKVAEGLTSDIVPFTANAAIKPGLHVANTLRVRAQGTHFAFYVNGVQVGQATDSQLDAGTVGFNGGSGIEVVYTDFTLTRLS
jgi:hypothetical protein